VKKIADLPAGSLSFGEVLLSIQGKGGESDYISPKGGGPAVNGELLRGNSLWTGREVQVERGVGKGREQGVLQHFRLPIISLSIVRTIL